MAVAPITAKLIAQAALAATDEQARKRLLIIILAPILTLLLLIAFIVYLITSPLSIFAQWVIGDELTAIETMQKDYGYNQSIGIYEQDYIDGAGQNYDGVVFTDGATEVVYFNQLDERWRDKPYGTDNIGGCGCGPTSMSIVVSSLTVETVDPPHMAQWAYENGYWCSGNGSYHSLIPGAAKAWGLSCEGDLSAQGIVDALSGGKLVVALMSKGHFTSGGPFIVLRGVTSEGKILVADPASVKRSNQEWDLSLIMDEARKGAAAGGPYWAIGHHKQKFGGISMILYLSSAQHSNLLDFTGLYDRDSTTTKKMVGSFVLKQFIAYDMRNFSHFTEVVLDRPAFGDSDAEFTEAIEEFLTMYSARITVICEGLAESDPLFAALLDSGVGNIVCDTEIMAMQCEISECLSENGMTRYNPKERTAKATGFRQYRFDCKGIRIAVLSSQPRMGATTTALGLCGWLRSVGATVCYVGANASGHLSLLAQSYEMEQDGNGWTYEGISYCAEEPTDPDVNFIICDAGNDLTLYVKSEAHADLLLLQCGTKPYELGYTLRLQKWFETEYAYILCPFVSEDAKGDYADALQSDYHKLLFLDCQPDLMNGTPNAKQYRTMISKYIAGA